MANARAVAVLDFACGEHKHSLPLDNEIGLGTRSSGGLSMGVGSHVAARQTKCDTVLDGPTHAFLGFGCDQYNQEELL